MLMNTNQHLKIFGKYKDSGIIDLFVLVIAYSIVIFISSNIWKSYGESGSLTSWQYSKDVQGQISLGGYWYAFITIPIYIFFFAKLLWKFLLWSIVLYKISKIDLNLFPTIRSFRRFGFHWAEPVLLCITWFHPDFYFLCRNCKQSSLCSEP